MKSILLLISCFISLLANAQGVVFNPSVPVQSQPVQRESRPSTPTYNVNVYSAPQQNVPQKSTPQQVDLKDQLCTNISLYLCDQFDYKLIDMGNRDGVYVYELNNGRATPTIKWLFNEFPETRDENGGFTLEDVQNKDGISSFIYKGIFRGNMIKLVIVLNARNIVIAAVDA